MAELKEHVIRWRFAARNLAATLAITGLLNASPVLAWAIDLNKPAKVADTFMWLAEMAAWHFDKVKAAKVANDKTTFCYEVSQANHYVLQMDDIARQVSQSWYNTPNWETAVRINKTSGVHTRAVDSLKAAGKCSI